MEHQAQLAEMDYLDYEDYQVLQDQLALLVKMETRETWAHLEKKGLKAQEANRY